MMRLQRVLMEHQGRTATNNLANAQLTNPLPAAAARYRLLAVKLCDQIRRYRTSNRIQSQPQQRLAISHSRTISLYVTSNANYCQSSANFQ